MYEFMQVDGQFKEDMFIFNMEDKREVHNVTADEVMQLKARVTELEAQLADSQDYVAQLVARNLEDEQANT